MSNAIEKMKFNIFAAAAGAQVQAQNRLGQYVPAIPEPFFHSFGHRCGCGQFFLRYESYRGHYALKHIMQLD